MAVTSKLYQIKRLRTEVANLKHSIQFKMNATQTGFEAVVTQQNIDLRLAKQIIEEAMILGAIHYKNNPEDFEETYGKVLSREDAGV
jgi:hypothetical protein